MNNDSDNEIKATGVPNNTNKQNPNINSAESPSEILPKKKVVLNINSPENTQQPKVLNNQEPSPSPPQNKQADVPYNNANAIENTQKLNIPSQALGQNNPLNNSQINATEEQIENNPRINSNVSQTDEEKVVAAKVLLNEEQTSTLKRMVSKNKKILTVSLIALIVLVLSCGILVALSTQTITPKVSKNDNTEQYADILTAEEQKEWKEKKLSSNEVTMQINQKIDVVKGSSEAHLRLINPPYSNFITQVNIILLDDGQGGTMEETIYSSEKLEPGTVVDYAKLTTNFSTGTYNARADFNFYNSLGTLVGTYGTSLELDVS